jgi:hypothetical protein
MQRAPDVTSDDVRRIVSRDFPAESRAAIFDLIDAVTVREKDRVVLACLKVSDGDLSRLTGNLENAPGYWREIISEAEYPGASKQWSKLADAPVEKQEQVYAADWSQYVEWLTAK